MGKRTLILLKSESDTTDRYVDQLRSNNFNPVFVPTLSFGFKNLETLRSKILTPDKFAGIIFTSPRCVEAVCEALKLTEFPSSWKLLHNYAVGEITHNMALSSLDQLFTHGKQTGNAANLAQYIIDTFDGAKHLPLLLPCGNLRTDTLLSSLASNGFLLDACEVYETVCDPNFAENMDRAMKADNVEFLLFFSPSGVNCAYNYFQAHNISPDQWKLIALGPSTRRALEEKGLTVYRTAEKPSVEYVIKVLIDPS